jgi:hypothetical protein
MINEFKGVPLTCNSKDEVCRFKNGNDVLEYYKFDQALSSVWFDLMFLAIITIVLKILAVIALAAFNRPRGA